MIKKINKRILNVLFALAIAVIIGLWNFGILATNMLAEGFKDNTLKYFINEMSGSFTFLILVPPLLWLFNAYPLRKKNLYKLIPLYIACSFLFGVCHTLLMKFSRELIYPLTGLGHYDYGDLVIRFVMEYHKQMVGFWTIAGVVHLIAYIKANQERKLKTARLEQELTKARLQALQMQLNPHFLFNTLNMISSTMYEDAAAADEMMAYLSDLLRITLNRTNKEEYPLEKELELLNLYLEIMKARFGEKLSIRIDVPPETARALAPAFVFQPLVENSIKYGMEELDKIDISISAQRVGDRLKLIVSDNGPGMKEDYNQGNSGGIGLANTVERLERLYGKDHRFHIENGGYDERGESGENIENGNTDKNAKKGLKVIMEFPFKEGANT